MKKSVQFFIKFIRHHKETLLLVITVALITILLHTSISIWLSSFSNANIPSIGTIHTLNVEVYGKDIQDHNGEKLIDWGIVYPGTLVNRTFNVTSKSNIDGILIIKTANWTFYNSQNETALGPSNKIKYMHLIPPKHNMTLIAPDETLELTLTLNVTSSNDFINFILEYDAKRFSFDIYIYIKETT
jgi:hypothetical protein